MRRQFLPPFLPSFYHPQSFPKDAPNSLVYSLALKRACVCKQTHGTEPLGAQARCGEVSPTRRLQREKRCAPPEAEESDESPRPSSCVRSLRQPGPERPSYARGLGSILTTLPAAGLGTSKTAPQGPFGPCQGFPPPHGFARAFCVSVVDLYKGLGNLPDCRNRRLKTTIFSNR